MCCAMQIVTCSPAGYAVELDEIVRGGAGGPPLGLESAGIAADSVGGLASRSRLLRASPKAVGRCVLRRVRVAGSSAKLGA